MTNDGPDTVSGCPVQMSGRIVFTRNPQILPCPILSAPCGLESGPGQPAC